MLNQSAWLMTLNRTMFLIKDDLHFQTTFHLFCCSRQQQRDDITLCNKEGQCQSKQHIDKRKIQISCLQEVSVMNQGIYTRLSFGFSLH